MLLLPEGKTGETWEPSKKQNPFGNQGALDIKVLCLFKSSVKVVRRGGRY
jgi:hypothetical protein